MVIHSFGAERVSFAIGFDGAPGRVFSREQLLDKVWGHGIYVEDRTVDVHMSRLRRALNKSGKGRQHARIIALCAALAIRCHAKIKPLARLAACSNFVKGDRP